MTPPSAVRWRPVRAGILNVYQYEDETLHFAGGRLLLRGVNGSGKSTAMNMLLPFLLEADTRRIDAAGEQTGVLKSWMLADNDETQRTGYLWIEFGRADGDVAGEARYHTVGCGIRANRSTDRTTTWWFSTSRRPRIDFSLTANRVPLAVDALRAELGGEAVFTSAAEYRSEISRRFFGGADPSGYLALLHQVRNPRVGDRIDADLPDRLREALPPVPEDAVADAAQPLEDLEDHRRNVVALERTDRALVSVLETYRSYARRVLRTAADRAAGSVTAARSALQRRGRLRTAAEDADAVVQRLQAEVHDLDRSHRATAAELSGLLRSDAYKQREALLARRDHVASLQSQARTLDGAQAGAQRRLDAAAGVVGARRNRVDDDLDRLRDDSAEVSRHAAAAGVTQRLAPPAELAVRSLAGGLSGPDPMTDPLRPVDPTPVADAVRGRRQDVRHVAGLVTEASGRRDAAARAEAEARRAEERAAAARSQAAQARAEAESAAAEHRAAVGDWTTRFAAHAAAVPAGEPEGTSGWLAAPDVADPGGDELRAVAQARVVAAVDAVAGLDAAAAPVVAGAAVRLHVATERAARLDGELADLRGRQELALPRPDWQGAEPADTALFASLVDFAPHLGPAERAGVEAACEAAGLLTATVRPDGSVVTDTGDLLVVPGAPVSPNLAALLVPESAAPQVVDALAQIGVGAGSGAALWVAEDGRFGAGPLRGRHLKPAAEHIGAGAREASRLRRIAELAAELTVAEHLRYVEQQVHRSLVAWRDELRALRESIPSTRPVDDAGAAAAGAVRDAQRAGERAEGERAAAVEAERSAEAAWALAQTDAARFGLVATAEALAEVGAALDECAAMVRRLPDRIGAARRSLRDWSDAVAEWEGCLDALTEAAEAAERGATVALGARTELDAVEAALGDSPERIAEQVVALTGRRDGLVEDLDARRAAHTAAVAAAATAQAEVAEAERDAERADAVCGAQRSALRAACAVPGLLAAARNPDAAGLPDVPDTVDGAARLVAGVLDAVPEPAREVGEDALDRSLRQVRDSLGAGWDAGSRRSEDGAPVAVEVSGPYGRRALLDASVQVEADLRRARGLLTAQQDQALRNLLHGRVAREVARSLFAATELVRGMNAVLGEVRTGQGIGVRLEWRTRGDLDQATATALQLLGKDPDARSETEDAAVRAAVAGLVEEARAADPEASYRDVIAQVLDYRSWHELRIHLLRAGRSDERLSRRTRLSEGEKKLVTYLPMAAAAAASAAAVDPRGTGAPRLIMLDDAFAKVSEDNHERLFGLLVSLDLDFVVTSERLFGTHASVPELSIIEVLRDPELRTIALLHYHWDGTRRVELTGA